jgi:hypothetical protein
LINSLEELAMPTNKPAAPLLSYRFRLSQFVRSRELLNLYPRKPKEAKPKQGTAT